jgi:hypothetical protein
MPPPYLPLWKVDPQDPLPSIYLTSMEVPDLPLPISPQCIPCPRSLPLARDAPLHARRGGRLAPSTSVASSVPSSGRRLPGSRPSSPSASRRSNPWNSRQAAPREVNPRTLSLDTYLIAFIVFFATKEPCP